MTFGTQRPTSRSASIVAASRCARNASTAGRSTEEWNGTSIPGRTRTARLPSRALERGERVRGARDRVLAAGRVVVDDLDGVVREQRFDVGAGGVDDGQPVGRGAVRAARDVRLHRLAAAVHERRARPRG